MLANHPYSKKMPTGAEGVSHSKPSQVRAPKMWPFHIQIPLKYPHYDLISSVREVQQQVHVAIPATTPLPQSTQPTAWHKNLLHAKKFVTRDLKSPKWDLISKNPTRLESTVPFYATNWLFFIDPPHYLKDQLVTCSENAT